MRLQLHTCPHPDEVRHKTCKTLGFMVRPCLLKVARNLQANGPYRSIFILSYIQQTHIFCCKIAFHLTTLLINFENNNVVVITMLTKTQNYYKNDNSIRKYNCT